MNLFRYFKRKSKTEAILYLCISFVFLLVALSYIYILVWAFFDVIKKNTEVDIKDKNS